VLQAHIAFPEGQLVPAASDARNVVEAVRAVLDRLDDELDYARAKIAFDRLVDPSIDEHAVLAELDRMAEAARKLAGPSPDDPAKLNALRQLIYGSGPWNEWRPFTYDHSNIRGQNVRLKLISHYLETRRGDCVSMPVLFLILANKLGLDMALSLAPNHLLLKHRFDDGRIINLEPTSGANPARDEWLRHIRPMSDRSIESGMYLRPLSRREGIASIASGVVQYLRDESRFGETAAVCEIILANHPRDGLVLVNLAGAYRQLLNQFVERYPAEFLIPLNLRPYCWTLLTRQRAAISKARALGWEDIDHCTQLKEKTQC
jgi:regulator of sirC expression with transglutaminase-like and TPR domain